MRLISVWLNNSLDPFDGNNKKFDIYWLKVVDEYNAISLRDRKRGMRHCKDHWKKSNKKIVHSNGIYCRLRDTYANSHSDDQLISQTRDMYKKEVGHPFILEHWWSAVRAQPKWCRSYFESLKRARLNEEGAHTSSSNNDNNDPVEVLRPEGRDTAKLKRKGKSKMSEGSSSRDEVLQHIGEANAELEKWVQNACAASDNLQEMLKHNERASLAKLLTKLLLADTFNWSDARQTSHAAAIEKLNKMIDDIDNK